MGIGALGGCLWGLDTVILGIAMALPPFVGPEAAAVAGIVGAALHDVFCAVWMFAYMGARRRWRDTMRALCTRSGKVVAFGALLGGPIGMTGYALAIANIGAGYTAIISAFYPALGTLLAALFLKEKMSVKQVVALLIALCAVCYMGFSASGATDVPGNAALGVAAAIACLVGWGSEAVLCAWGMRDDAVDNQTALHIRETTSALAYLIVVIPLFGAGSLTLAALPAPADAGVALAAAAGTASYLCYYRAIASIGAARGMAINISYAAWAVVFGVILQHAMPSSADIVCCIAIMVGTVLAASDWNELFGRRGQRKPIEP